MLRESVPVLRRVVRNLQQEVGGYSSKVPGSGEPGGGKGARSTVSLADPGDDIDPAGWDTPVTSVEVQALGLGGRDEAAEALSRLERALAECCDALLALALASPRRRALAELVATGRRHGPAGLLVPAYVLARLVASSSVDLDPRLVASAHRATVSAFHICQNWSYEPGRPHVTKKQRELLAVDTTETWCTSHLRVGERRERDRGELCQWCRKFRAVEGFIPPAELVQLHVDQRRVYDHQIAPHRANHRQQQQGEHR